MLKILLILLIELNQENLVQILIHLFFLVYCFIKLKKKYLYIYICYYFNHYYIFNIYIKLF